MPMEMLEADPADVLHALNQLEQTIHLWKAAVEEVQASGAPFMSIAQGPYRPSPGPLPPGPPPPFTDCEANDFISVKPRNACLHFDIDVYVDQVAGFLFGLYYGLQHDQEDVSNT